jgi:NAD(P)-dependent dehydrogenase (short-subunit alcohol dehydrogenase family)
MADQRVVVVTGGGGGIGAAVATEVARTGAFVVTLDPLVTVDGVAQAPTGDETTAGRIVAAGGSARASAASVTDGGAVSALFGQLVAEFGRLDGVVNVAGITRPTSFTRGSEDDWLAVLDVHLNGYRNVLEAALPIMAEAGYGNIVGVTSGSGWRAADAGAYSCAKRAVAALTWQLGRQAPPGVVVNAMSPIAATRMVTAALGRAQPASQPAAPSGSSGTPAASGVSGSATAASGGLSLASMPTAEEIGPMGAYLVSDQFSWCSGQVIFAGGSEVAVIDQPRLIEVVRVDGAVTSLAHVLGTVIPGALVPAEAAQGTTGASNSRFSSMFDDAATDEASTSTEHTCAVICDDPDVGAAVSAALAGRGMSSAVVAPADKEHSFDNALQSLAAVTTTAGPLDAVVVALAGGEPAPGGVTGWQQILAEHTNAVAQLHADACWTRAVAEYAAEAGRPVRLLTLTDATTSGGRSRAQAVAQLARSARRATKDRVAAFSISIETPWADGASPTTELVAHLVTNADAAELSGAELVVGSGWIGLRSHPRPTGSISYGGPDLPDWLDQALRDITLESHP